MSRNRYKIFDNDHPHFITSTIVQWLPFFSNPDIVKIILDSMAFMQHHNRMKIFAYVIMENHLHLSASSQNLSKEIGDFKSFTARQIIDFYKEYNPKILNTLSEARQSFKKDRDYQFWQEGNHPKQITSHHMMIQKIEYIHQNPVRRGYVDDPIHWRYSSARNYIGKEGLISINTDW